MHLDIK